MKSWRITGIKNNQQQGLFTQVQKTEILEKWGCVFVQNPITDS